MIEIEGYHVESEDYVHTTCRDLASKMIVRQRSGPLNLNYPNSLMGWKVERPRHGRSASAVEAARLGRVDEALPGRGRVGDYRAGGVDRVTDEHAPVSRGGLDARTVADAPARLTPVDGERRNFH